jgi:hypothetical protein
MKNFNKKIGIEIPLFLGLLLIGAGLSIVPQASAVSQFSRKYSITCTTCHTAFPRLNHFGERFMQNGYQMPGTENGSEVGKEKISDMLTIDNLKNFLGVRLSLDAVNVQTKAQDRGGESNAEAKVDIGNPNWLQIFTAGSIFKNLSIFIETEIEEDEIHFSWYRLGFHNLFGLGSLLNIRIGNTSMMDWHVLSGRLRMISNIRNEATRYLSSDGEGEDSVNMSSAAPAISLYGYTHGITYEAGISNGKSNQSDPNRFKNYFGTLKYQAESGALEGSGISFWGMYGTDTKDYSEDDIRNGFWRFSPGLNLRYDEDLDILVAYFMGRDENYFLVDNSFREPNDMQGIAAQIGYNVTSEIFTALQYDFVEDEADSQNFNKISPSISYFFIENMRLSLTARFDILDEAATDPRHLRQDEYILNFRVMF